VNADYNREAVLEKARAWPDGETVNWSAWAKSEGLTKPNGGQTLKEDILRELGQETCDKMEGVAAGTPKRERKVRKYVTVTFNAWYINICADTHLCTPLQMN